MHTQILMKEISEPGENNFVKLFGVGEQDAGRELVRQVFKTYLFALIYLRRVMLPLVVCLDLQMLWNAWNAWLQYSA